jgi:poly(A) polymerase
MKLPEASWQTRPGMLAVLRALDAENGTSRFVGGAVRDELLLHQVNDIDIATQLPPQDVVDRLRKAGIKAVPTGLAHGTITAVPSDGPVEITTLRRDVSTDGRRATVAFTCDWEEDAARRDFTINALSADPVSREIFDYFGGLADLEARHVRFIGDPLTRIAEDHLRILRFFRFHARFGKGDPDAAGLDACVARANDLMALSRERIADELLKLLALPDPVPTVRLMVARGILKPVLPEIADVDALQRLVDRERAAGFDPAALRRLAALLASDPKVADSIAARLRLSKKAAKRLGLAAGRRDNQGAPAALAYRIGRDEAVDRLLLGTGPVEAATDLKDWQRPHFPLTGGDLIALGLSAGPIVAEMLQAMETDWVRGGFVDDATALRAKAQAIIAASD